MKNYLTVAEFARVHDVDRQMVYQWINSKPPRVRFKLVDGRLKIREDAQRPTNKKPGPRKKASRV